MGLLRINNGVLERMPSGAGCHLGRRWAHPAHVLRMGVAFQLGCSDELPRFPVVYIRADRARWFSFLLIYSPHVILLRVCGYYLFLCSVVAAASGPVAEEYIHI